MKALPLVLPPDLAYLAAAVQNFDRDIRKRLLDERHWSTEKDVYLQEAFITMQEEGENYPPYYPEHDHIKVYPVERKITHTARSRAFLAAVDEWFEQRVNARWLGQLTDLLPPSPVFFLNYKDVHA